MKKLVSVTLLVLLVLAGWMLLRPIGDSGRTPADRTLARERAAAHFATGDLARAREAIAPLVSVGDPALEDLVRAAVIEFSDRTRSDPLPALERVRRADPEHPVLHYMLARVSLETGDFEGAADHYRSVLRRDPEDLATQVGLAATLDDLGRAPEAEGLLRAVLALGVDHAGVWYVQAVIRLLRISQLADRSEDEQRFADLYAQLQELGYRAASPAELDQGTLAIVLPPDPDGVEGARTGRLPDFTGEAAILPELGGALELWVLDVEDDGDLDFLAAGARGVLCAVRDEDGYEVETVVSGPVEHVRAFDLGNDDSLDLLVSRGARLALYEAATGADLLMLDNQAGAQTAPRRWSPSDLELPPLPAPPADLVLGDLDHDGDLDLLAVGSFGARLLRNDGAAPRVGPGGRTTRGAFVDASSEAGLPTGVELTWCTTEDFDNDSDVDLLMGGPGALVLMDSLRSGGFRDIAAQAFGAGAAMAHEPVVADFDGDARPDLFEAGRPARLWRQRPDGTLVGEATRHEVLEGTTPLAVDVDLDGTLDVLWPESGSGVAGALGLGLQVETEVRLSGADAGSGPIAAGDLDGDRDLDLVRVTPAGLVIQRCQGPVGNGALLRPLGLKDNRRAVGAVVEVRSRGLYRRIYWRGGARLVGCGPYATIDVVRITWPNGVVQTSLDVEPTGQPFLDTATGGIEQTEALSGSCPFLYSWNGDTFEFVSDVLGGTPLGLPMAPGVLVPPDHDEFVLVRGDQLVPRDGALELQFTEELREVTYLDRIRLDVVDHPAGTEVFPNERFSFPPFPEPHVHSVRAALTARSALGSDGADWTSALAAVDDVHAVPFEPLEPQFLGLAEPYWLELEFDPARVAGAELLRLVFTGWFYWTDASVNVASARTPGVEFVPPILQVLGADGEWTDAGPPVGFPAGKSKTMVIDVTTVLDPANPRLRVVSTLRLYWDCIRLAVDGDDAPLRTSSLEPTSAVLWPRGFSRRIETGRDDLPERFEWGALTEHRSWNQHPGRYTRYGETVALLGAIDDRFVVMGSGDALAVSFDASALPPLEEGWVRDYLVFLDGWAKDRDPNTVEALEVEPLPFHGMSGYPYGPGESFPDDALHRAWRAEWNTRPARAWIPPLSPRRETEWALDTR